MSSTQLLCTVSSDGTVSPGQNNRSSKDFTLSIPDAAIDLQWNVAGTSNTGVTFNVMQDISLSPDPTLAKGLSNGSLTGTSSFDNGGKFYIANPSNNPGDPPPAFNVEIYAVFPS